MSLVNCGDIMCPVSCGPGQQGAEVAGNYGTEGQMVANTSSAAGCCWQASYNYIQNNCVSGGGLYESGPKPDFGLTEYGSGGKQVQGKRPRPSGGRKPARTGGMVFRGADGKLLEGKQKVLGVELPKVLIVAGVAVAAYFIVKKLK